MRKFVLLFLLLLPVTAAAHPPWAIVADDKNQIYLSDLETIWKIDAAGKVSVFRAGVSGRHTHEIALDKDGNLLGEDLTYEPATKKFITSLWKMSPNGNFSFTLAPTAAPPKAISIWKNQAGATFYFGQTENKERKPFLLKRSANGAVSALFGESKNALQERQVILYSLAGMSFAADGTLFVTNRSSIWKVAPDDKVTILINQSEIAKNFPNAQLYGLTVDPQNNVYTADFGNKKILKIASDGKISVFAESHPNWLPTGVYFRNGNLYVLEAASEQSGAKIVVRVRKIASDGTASTVATINENKAAAQTDEQKRPSSDSPADKDNSCAAIGFVVAACFIFRR
jgi:sugar lactone lactonase YvrE